MALKYRNEHGEFENIMLEKDNIADGAITREKLSQEVIDYFYPVGSIYISYSSTSPASIFGGSWTQITGRFLRMANDVSTGGSDSVVHSHTYGLSYCEWYGAYDYYNYALVAVDGKNSYARGSTTVVSTNITGNINNGSGGAGTSRTNMSIKRSLNNTTNTTCDNKPAYQDLYTWRRTA